jgi:hypothetical protein
MPAPSSFFHRRRSTVAPSVSISPPSSTKSLTTSQSYSQLFTATPSGMVGPVTYLWAWQSGGTGFSLSTTTASSTTVSSPARANGTSQSGILQVTATDTGDGNKQYTDTASIDAAWGTGV